MNPTVTVYVTPSIMLPVHIPEVLEHVSELLLSELIALTVVVVTGQRKPVFGSCGGKSTKAIHPEFTAHINRAT